MPEATVVFRGIREMVPYFLERVGDHECLVEYLYPTLLRFAGESRTPIGAATMIRHAVAATAGECIHGVVTPTDARLLSLIVEGMVGQPATAEVKRHLFTS